MSNRIKISAGCILLAIGGLIYFLYRSNTILYRLFPNDIWIWNSMRGTAPALNDFLVFNLPGGLWSASYILIVDALFCKCRRTDRLTIAAVIPMIGAMSELLQAFGILPGIFDWADFWCYAAPYIIYIMVLR